MTISPEFHFLVSSLFFLNYGELTRTTIGRGWPAAQHALHHQQQVRFDAIRCDSIPFVARSLQLPPYVQLSFFFLFRGWSQKPRVS